MRRFAVLGAVLLAAGCGHGLSAADQHACDKINEQISVAHTYYSGAMQRLTYQSAAHLVRVYAEGLHGTVEQAAQRLAGSYDLAAAAPERNVARAEVNLRAACQLPLDP